MSKDKDKGMEEGGAVGGESEVKKISRPFLRFKCRPLFVIVWVIVVALSVPVILEHIFFDGVSAKYVYPSAAMLSAFSLVFFSYRAYCTQRTDLRFFAFILHRDDEMVKLNAEILNSLGTDCDYALYIQVGNASRHPTTITSLQSDSGFKRPLLHERADGRLDFSPKILDGEVFKSIIPIDSGVLNMLVESRAICVIDLADKKYYLDKKVLQELKTRIEYLGTQRRRS